MKVSVLTIIGIESYGSLLQTFATQKKLEEYAGEVEIIRCVHQTRFSQLVEKINNPIKVFLMIPTYLLHIRNYFAFAKKHLNLTKETFLTDDDFERQSIDADIFCTGSDQIWNPDCVPQMPLKPRFLSFIPDGKRKFAYSASFGKDKMEEDEVVQSKEYIEQYESISVREDGGVSILENQYGYLNAIQLVDPTLAMPPEFWRKYAPETMIQGEYILIFVLKQDKRVNKYAQILSERTGIRLIRLCPRFHHIFLNGESILIPPIFSFITLIDNAKYVITDSFHALAFSINMNTEPICVYQSSPGRLASLLRLIDAEYRAITDFEDFEIINRPIDFNQVNRVLAHERERVNAFLSSIFYKGDRHEDNL